jgi:hypothetical protein
LDTSDNKESGTETGAIFAGLGCEVPVPRKAKETKRKHAAVRDESVLKTIQERTKEILKAQFSKEQQKENADTTASKNETVDSIPMNEIPISQFSTSKEQSKQNCDKTETKNEVGNSDEVMNTCVRTDVAVNDGSGSTTSGLNRLPSTTARPVSDTTSEIQSDGQMLADETVKAGDVQESGFESRGSNTQTSMRVSRSSGKHGSSKVNGGLAEERSGVKKEMKKKSKKRKRNSKFLSKIEEIVLVVIYLWYGRRPIYLNQRFDN